MPKPYLHAFEQYTQTKFLRFVYPMILKEYVLEDKENGKYIHKRRNIAILLASEIDNDIRNDTD